MKRKQGFITILGVLAFLLLCLVPNGTAQQIGTPISQAEGPPWQLGLLWTFNASSSSTSAFNVAGLSYYRILWVPSGTVSGCSMSIDGAAAPGGAFTTGGILSSATIGPCTSASMYVTTSAAGIAVLGQITPTITGSGSVTVVLFGYTDNPAAGGSIGGSVAVTNFPATNTVIQPSGTNLHTVIDSLPSLAPGTNNIGGVTANQSLATAGYGKVTDGTNVQAVKPASVAAAAGDPASVVSLSPNSPLPAGTNAIGSVNGASSPGDAAANPSNAVPGQSFLQGWNGSTWDRLRTAGVGNVVAATGLQAHVAYCEYLSALPSLTTGLYAAAQCDSSGRLLVNVSTLPALPAGGNTIGAVTQASGPWTNNVTQFGGSPIATGTGAGGSGIPRVTVSNDSQVNTQPAGFGSIVSFQQAVTASAVVLASNSVHGFCVKALPTNSITVYVGPTGVTTSTGYPLAAGDNICFQGSNTNVAYVIATTTGASVAVSGN